MSDYYENNNNVNNSSDGGNFNESSYNSNPLDNSKDVYSSSDSASTSSSENSYEWNGTNKTSSNEYHYSYVNGNNKTASHNPNNYETAYSYDNTQTTGNTQSNPYTSTQKSTDSSNNASYSSSYYSSSNSSANPNTAYNNYSNPNYSNPSYNQSGVNYANQHTKKAKQKRKKVKKPVTRGALAAVIIIAIIASAAFGFGGGYLANQISTSSNGGININKVSSGSTTNTGSSTASNTSAIVQKAADSVVEIATESVVTGSFARQYVQQGAGSGVIISEDGYIITNYHVIEGANNVTVTLRDGKTSYTAAVIGSDAEEDIALLKVDAKGLTPATFGDSSSLAVGDYVVAIGNPLGELGGTVTDGIISALAREVEIENNNMTLLQTNAQISPGNSGGGLFNANGELIGIVNAKDSATEVEGIGFAIPINNVLDIINDLKSYGYVTGKVSLGMQFTDINSNESAFYYGVNEKGCYVISVTKGSNAEKAGFRTGDLITKVNGTDITYSSDIDKALENAKVGDTVKFTVYRSGETLELNLTLEEYVPSGGTSNQLSTAPASDDRNSDDSIWSQMFGW